MSPPRHKPTRSEQLAAKDKLIPDILQPGIRVLFVGINPGLHSAAIGCHFGRPGNRFWPALHGGGFTPRVFSPFDQWELPPLGWGITNIVPRASARADELTPDELRTGGKVLRQKVRRYSPQWVAILGVTAYRQAFDTPSAKLGRQDHDLEDAGLWILPNPSGLNAHFQADDLARLFGELRGAVG